MILGACSRCGGTVEVPDMWMGIDPPRPRCRRCNATKKMKVIEMDEPAPRPTKFENYCENLKRELETPVKIDAFKTFNETYRRVPGDDLPLDDVEYLNKVGNG